MDRNFWNKLTKPIFIRAPMADVTDAAFRRVIAKRGKPSVFFTEFVSADGLALAPEEGRKKLLRDLEYTEAERPIVAQFFTSSPENMEKAAQLARELGFDGVDINMGCPDRSVEKQGAGARLIKNPVLARELIRAAKRGAGGIPVSVKTRLGYNQVELGFIEEILKEDLPVLTVHLRTRKEMSKVSAHWELMEEIVEMRDRISPSTLIIGNGDVKNLEEAREKVLETGCDGVMLGRAIFGNPWLFAEPTMSDLATPKGRTLSEQLETLIEHTHLFEELFGSHKSFAIMKKHFKAYVNGFDGASELRAKLMEKDDAKGVEEEIEGFMKSI